MSWFYSIMADKIPEDAKYISQGSLKGKPQGFNSNNKPLFKKMDSIVRHNFSKFIDQEFMVPETCNFCDKPFPQEEGPSFKMQVKFVKEGTSNMAGQIVSMGFMGLMIEEKKLCCEPFELRILDQIKHKNYSYKHGGFMTPLRFNIRIIPNDSPDFAIRKKIVEELKDRPLIGSKEIICSACDTKNETGSQWCVECGNSIIKS